MQLLVSGVGSDSKQPDSRAEAPKQARSCSGDQFALPSVLFAIFYRKFFLWTKSQGNLSFSGVTSLYASC